MNATAVLPVKRFDAAKQRLAAGIDEPSGAASWPAAMVADVLEAIGEARSIERLIVVTGDPIAQELAAEAGAEVVPDPEDAGHVEAAQAGIARAEAEGAERVVLLAGDCPLLDPRELDRLLTGVPGSYVGIVPDRHGTGTNALLLSPPGAIVPAFGEGSRDRHVEAARAGRDPLRDRGAALDRTRPRHPGRRDRADPRAGDAAEARAPHRQGAGDMSAELRVLPVEGMPEVREGDEVGELIAARAELQDGDVVVISQKVVSKAEGMVRQLSEVKPSEKRPELADEAG